MLMLRNARKSPPSGEWSADNYGVFDGGRLIGHIMLHPETPAGQPWFWTITARNPQSKHDSGHAETLIQAMEDFKARLMADS